MRILTATDDKHRYGVQLRGQLNHRTVGIRLKKDYKAVVEAVKSMSTSDLELFAKVSFAGVCFYLIRCSPVVCINLVLFSFLVQTGSISVCGHVLSGDDMTVVYTTGGNQDEKPATEAAHVKTKKGNNKDGKENKAVSSNAREGIQRYEAASDSHGLLVILDTTADEELEHERLARELINRIQRTRKKVGYKIGCCPTALLCYCLAYSTRLCRHFISDAAWSVVSVVVRDGIWLLSFECCALNPLVIPQLMIECL